MGFYAAFHTGWDGGEGCRAIASRASDADSVPMSERIYPPLFVDRESVHHVTRFNFTYNPVSALADYRRAENLDSVVRGAKGDFEKARALMRWTRQQWNPGRPDPYPPINAMIILREIRAGRTGGFCAQYNYVFVQAVQSFGIRARYVTLPRHEVTEVWVREMGKWVCFDPLYEAFCTDQEGTPLSVYEIYAASRRNTPVIIRVRRPIPGAGDYIRLFERFAVWLKNDHVSSPMNFEDIEYYKVHFFEKPEELSEEITRRHLATSSLVDLYGPPE